MKIKIFKLGFIIGILIMEHRTMDQLESGITTIIDSPRDNGTLHMIVSRPAKKERATPEQCTVSRKGGVEGDHWAKGCWKSLPDGTPDPSVQLTIMNSRCLDLLAGEKFRWPLAGDNLIVDMDLGVHNLKTGQKLSLGSAILEITEVPHTGCIKFSDRFGIDALKFVSTKKGKELRLRGVYARVTQDGQIRIGDRLKKIEG